MLNPKNRLIVRLMFVVVGIMSIAYFVRAVAAFSDAGINIGTEVDSMLVGILYLHLPLGLLSLIAALQIRTINIRQLWVMGTLCFLSGIALAISLTFGFPL